MTDIHAGAIKAYKVYDKDINFNYLYNLVRSILKYASTVFHCSLSKYLSDELERVQKQALIAKDWKHYSQKDM